MDTSKGMLEKPSALHFRFCREKCVCPWRGEWAPPKEADSPYTGRRPWADGPRSRISEAPRGGRRPAKWKGKLWILALGWQQKCEGNLFKAALLLKAAGRWQESHRVTAHTALVARRRELWGPERRQQLGWEQGLSAEAGGRWPQEEAKMRLVLRSICPSQAPTERLYKDLNVGGSIYFD